VDEHRSELGSQARKGSIRVLGFSHKGRVKGAASGLYTLLIPDASKTTRKITS
jgi:hypothetical protein